MTSISRLTVAWVALAIATLPHEARADERDELYRQLGEMASHAGKSNDPLSVFEKLGGTPRDFIIRGSVTSYEDVARIFEGAGADEGLAYMGFSNHSGYKYVAVNFFDPSDIAKCVPKTELDFMVANMGARIAIEEAHHYAASGIGSRVLLQARHGLSDYLKFLAYTGRQYDPEGAIAAFLLHHGFPFNDQELARYAVRGDYVNWIRGGRAMTNPVLSAEGKVGIDLGLRNIRLGEGSWNYGRKPPAWSTRSLLPSKYGGKLGKALNGGGRVGKVAGFGAGLAAGAGGGIVDNLVTDALGNDGTADAVGLTANFVTQGTILYALGGARLAGSAFSVGAAPMTVATHFWSEQMKADTKRYETQIEGARLALPDPRHGPVSRSTAEDLTEYERRGRWLSWMWGL